MNAAEEHTVGPPHKEANHKFPPERPWSSYTGSVVLGEETCVRQKHSRWLLVTKSQLEEVCDDYEKFFKTYSNLRTRMDAILETGDYCFAAMQINGTGAKHMEIVFGMGENFEQSTQNLQERSRRRFDESGTPNTMKGQLRFRVGSDDLAALCSATAAAGRVACLDMV